MRKFLWRLLNNEGPTIRDFLAEKVGEEELARLRTSSKDLPGFRFVDLYEAAKWYSAEQGLFAELQSEHGGIDLTTLLHDRTSNWVQRTIRQARSLGWMIDVDRERYLPVEQFWITERLKDSGARAIIRLSYIESQVKARLEVAAGDADAAAEAMQAIIDRSASHSIYRNHVLELAFVSGSKDEYGDIEKPEHLRVLFKRLEPVGEADIVIEDDVRDVLVRNVLDLHRRRDILKANGVPIRRGVLLYGPPGTGKTFACRYVFGSLPDVTRIVVAGTALPQVTQVFNLARLYQPSLVLFEDVDLVFMSREISLYSSVLGELLDQMDGLRPYEDIAFLLTTNSIERMEAAIKDRPGRVGQCIYFGPPKTELRRRYLTRYLKTYDLEAVDIGELVKMSEDATQAFLKEWVHRSVQIATERLSTADERARLCTDDFRKAVDEMTRFSEGSTGQIIGFVRPAVR